MTLSLVDPRFEDGFFSLSRNAVGHVKVCLEIEGVTFKKTSSGGLSLIYYLPAISLLPADAFYMNLFISLCTQRLFSKTRRPMAFQGFSGKIVLIKRT